MIGSMRAAVLQLNSGPDLQANLATVVDLVARAADQGAQLVALPENFCFEGPQQHKVELAEDPLADDPGPVLNAMRRTAATHSIHLLLGGMPTPCATEGKVHNTALLLAPDGQILANYNKIHLFDVDVPGGTRFRESDHVESGRDVVTAQVGPARLGLSICYDLRFPELYRRLVAQGATVLCVPSAFTLQTGKDHWLPLLRARAIENQAYVLAPGQFGPHGDRRVSYGKSCIVNPWGAVLAQAADQVGLAVADLDLDYQAQIRQDLPCLSHMRLR